MSQTMDCGTARKLMDRREWLDGEDGARLKAHLDCCECCALEAKVEAQLRPVIAPVKLPTPTPSFERILKRRLGIAPAPRPDPFAQWGWVVGALTIAGMVAPLVYQTWETILHYAEIVSTTVGALLRPTAALTAPVIERGDVLMQNYGGALTLNLVLGAALLIGSVAAYRLAVRD